MPKWYGHTVEVKISDEINFPKIKGKLSLVNDIISDETKRLQKKLNFMRYQLTSEIALRSQIIQKNTITELGAVDTGRLRESVRIVQSGNHAEIGTALGYAETVHDIGYKHQSIFNINGIIVRGHSNIGPRPWSDISAKNLAGEIDDVVSGMIRDYI